MSRRLVERFRQVPMILVMGTIFFLSHQTGSDLSLPSFPGSDKVAHLIAYGVLGATVFFAFTPGKRCSFPRKYIIMAVLVALIYGILDEFHQSFIPGREVSAGDVLADLTGGIAGVLLHRYFDLRQCPGGRRKVPAAEKC